MKKVPLRRVALATVMLSTVVTSGCFGSFPLTRKLHNYNKTFSKDKFVQELFFFATAFIVPVYSVAGLIDVVILNSQEFWTGKSSMSSSGPETKVKTLVRGNVTIKQTMTQLASGRTLVLEETVDGKFKSRTTLRQDAGAAMVSSETEFADGRKESKTLTVDEAGAMSISSGNGPRRMLTSGEIAAASSRLNLGSFATAAR